MIFLKDLFIFMLSYVLDFWWDPNTAPSEELLNPNVYRENLNTE